MTSHATHRNPRSRAVLRRAFAWVAALGLLGAAAQADAIVRLERQALEARVDAVRAALHEGIDANPATATDEATAPRLTAQWNNWKNWNNWNNWKNWGNWLNR